MESVVDPPASLISGLKVDTAPLETVLLNLSRTLKHHDSVVSKWPAFEAAQCELRKDLKKLRLALESTASTIVSDDAANELDACDDGETAPQEDHSSISSYGVRKCDIEAIRLKHAGLPNANDQSIAKSLREIKSTIRRLQQDRDEGIVNSMELDASIKSMKDNLFEIEQKLTSSATNEQMQLLQQSLVAKYGQMENHLHEFKTRFHQEVDGSINQNISEIKAWFKDVEALAKQRQAKLEQTVASCAREYDVAAFRERIESDVASLARKAAFLDDTAVAQGKTLVRLQQKNAIAMFHRQATNWKQNALKVGLSRWKKVVTLQIQYESGKEAQKRLLRKMVTNIMSRRKRFGFERWIRYRDWHRRTERQKIKASTLICEKLCLYLSAPKMMAFNRWRRLTLLDRMKCQRRDAAGSVEEEEEVSSSSALSPSVTQSVTTLRLDSIVDSFGGDVRGATYALAQEIESIKSQDIASLRQDWGSENENLMSTIRTTVDEAFHKVTETTATLHETLNERVESCTNDLPILQSNLKELSAQFTTSKGELKRVEESHQQKIDALFQQDQQLEQRLHVVEDQTNTSSHQITSLFEEQTKSNHSIQYLHELIAKNEERHEEERRHFQQALNHFGDELLKTKVTLGHTQVKCESLKKELSDTKQELVHFQDASQSENDLVLRQIHHPGLPKPSLDRIVNIGHAYETLAKEKTYVTGINVMATLRTSTNSKLKRSGEKIKHEEEVNVPSEIVAFAHDYAAWVAYQADHESLLRLIAGTNPDDQVYAEDDMLSRRKELCDGLKSELSTRLEKASSYDKKEHHTTSLRGGGLRWEARAIFLARVTDSVDAALSKHDQLVLPASTRLGRVRPMSANVTVCVACDRPMRRRKARSDSAKAPKEEKSSGKADKMSDGTLGVDRDGTPVFGEF